MSRPKPTERQLEVMEKASKAEPHSILAGPHHHEEGPLGCIRCAELRRELFTPKER